MDAHVLRRVAWGLDIAFSLFFFLGVCIWDVLNVCVCVCICISDEVARVRLHKRPSSPVDKSVP